MAGLKDIGYKDSQIREIIIEDYTTPKYGTGYAVFVSDIIPISQILPTSP